MNKENPETFHPENEQEWRTWLEENHLEKQSVWLIYYKKSTGKKSLAWSEAVDQALCFGWIDSTARPIDEHTYMQFFTKRKPKSPWSKINKEKVASLLAEDLIAEAGHKIIEL
ncbi:MAG: YdeI/OmpD-associated family protein, partial [Fluviicola sp.]